MADYTRSHVYKTVEGDSSDWREIHRRSFVTDNVVDLTISSPAARALTHPKPTSELDPISPPSHTINEELQRLADNEFF
jgi:hypothetical protein